MKAEWRSVWTMCGALCVVTPGDMLMLQQYVGNQDIPPKVERPATCTYLLKISGVYFIFVYKQTDAVAYSNRAFGAGVGPVYLDSVDCTGSESNLTDCPHSSFVNCYSWNRGAGVRCQGMYRIYDI